MIIRSAYLEGDVAEADRAEFDRRMTKSVLPAIRTYPRIRDARLRRVVEKDDGVSPIFMIFDLYFDSIEDMRAALASETRQLVRLKIGEAMTLFKGRVYHVVLEQS